MHLVKILRVMRFGFRRFKNGNESIENEQRQGRPEAFSNEEVQQYLVQNHCASCSDDAQ